MSLRDIMQIARKPIREGGEGELGSEEGID